MGPLKFALAVVMVIAGILGIGVGILSCIGAEITSARLDRNISDAQSWIIGIIAFLVLLGGVFILSKRK
jgi:hypothetical protein